EPGAPEKHQVRISGIGSPHEVVVQVEDSGRGVPPELLPRLFQPSVTTKTKGDGHGMGLSICRIIVEEAGGSIRCVPDVPHGPVFETRLPVRPPTAQLPAPVQPKP